MSEHLNSNLKYLRESRNLTQEALGKKFDVSRGSISSYEDGRAEPANKLLYGMAQFFDVSMEQLLTVNLRENPHVIEENLKRKKEHAFGGNLRVLSTVTDSNNDERVIFIPHKASAGYAGHYADPAALKNSYQTFSLPVPVLPKGRTYRAFEVQGDSMLPLILPNSFVIGEYVENFDSIKDGQICVVVTKEGVVLKKVHNHIKERQCLLLMSSNMLYEPYEVKIEEVLEVWKFYLVISRDLPDEKPSVEELHRAVERLNVDIMRLKSWQKKRDQEKA